jgi:hypothetical protein
MYELGSFIAENGIVHRQHSEKLKSYIALTG